MKNPKPTFKGTSVSILKHLTRKKLEEAVIFCSSSGIKFYAVNKNFPEEIWDENDSRKILADIYIDDRNLREMP